MIKKTISIINEKIVTAQQKELIEEYSNRLNSNNVPIIYNLRHLRGILKIRRKEQNDFFGEGRSINYKVFYIPKKAGGYRKIEAPVEKLCYIQKWIKVNILDSIKVSDNAKGFKKNTSIIENARPHVGKEVVINLDIKDFFPSINYAKVFRFFIYIGYTKEVAHLLTQLCTNGNNVLPQGAPTSPGLSNIICLKLDKRLTELAKKVGCSYSRYADDITFSGKKEIIKIIPLIKRIIQDEGYVINEKKFRIQFSNHLQVVTGLTVNKKINISKQLKKEIENAIFYAQKFGVDKHMQNINCNRFFYKEHLYGIAYFVKMIDKEKGEKYLNGLDKIEWFY